MQELEIQSSTSVNMTVALDTDPQTDPTYEDTTATGYHTRCCTIVWLCNLRGDAMPLVVKLNQPRFQDIFIKNTLAQVLDFLNCFERELFS